MLFAFSQAVALHEKAAVVIVQKRIELRTHVDLQSFLIGLTSLFDFAQRLEIERKIIVSARIFRLKRYNLLELFGSFGILFLTIH